MALLYWFEDVRTPFLNQLMLLVTRLGEETFFMVIAIVIFWCINKKEGYYLLTVGFLGTIVNQFLKLIFRIPRPWILDHNFTIVESAREAATGYSFPSGHTQNAVGTFGCIARTTKNRWIRFLCILILSAVSISRMYLGVHTPYDVITSFLIATILVFAIYPLFTKISLTSKYFLWILSGLTLSSAVYLIFVYVFPFPDNIDPINLANGIENGWKLLGAMVGMVIASFIDQKYIQFSTKAVWWVQIVKVLLGLIFLIVIKEGLKISLFVLFGNVGLASAVRYCIVVLFAAAIWPATFKKFERFGHKKSCKVMK